MSKAKRASLPAVPALFGAKIPQPIAQPRTAVLQTEKKPAVTAPKTALYTFPLYPTSVRPAGLHSWVGTQHVVVRKDRLMQTPKGYDALPPHSQEHNAELTLKGYLATKTSPFARVLTFPASYEEKISEGKYVRVDTTLGLYVSGSEGFLFDQAFGPAPRTLWAPSPLNKERPFATDSGRGEDVALVAVRFTVDADCTEFLPLAVTLVTEGYEVEGQVILHLIGYAMAPRDPVEGYDQDRTQRANARLLKELQDLEETQLGSAQAKAIAAAEADPIQALRMVRVAAAELLKL